jgi:SAM-dependent methyltransferase
MLSHRLPTELQRLQVMERMLDPDETATLGGLGIQPWWHCLELGAGAGSIARWLAERCPAGQVVAADVDTGFLNRLRSHNLRVVQRDVERADFTPGSFDLVHARALFMHLADREAMLGRAAGWLKPGGWLAVSEADMFPVDSTPHPAMKTMWTAAEQLFRSQGSDPRWARRLPLLFGRAGLVDIGMTVKVDVFGGGGVTDEFWRSSFAQVMPFLLKKGLVDESVYAEAQALLDDPDFRDTLWAYVRVWGRRPPD